MTQRADDLYLVDVVETAEALETLLSNRTLEDFRQDDTLRSAASWKLFVIAEAASKFSPSVRARFNDVPWDDLRAFSQSHGPRLFFS